MERVLAVGRAMLGQVHRKVPASSAVPIQAAVGSPVPSQAAPVPSQAAVGSPENLVVAPMVSRPKIPVPDWSSQAAGSLAPQAAATTL